MKEILLTSSALILALLVVRMAFREKISRRVQYALWGLVLLRLLVPVNLPAVDFSVLSVAEPTRAQVAERLEKEPVYVLPVQRQEVSLSSNMPAEPTVILPIEGRHVAVTSEKGQPVVLTSYAFTLEETLGLVWITGMVGMGVWLAVSNLRFWFMLRRKRVPLELPECRYPVYLVEERLVSPCLFGLFRPAVYLTPAALKNEEGLRHVLTHEETHGRHGDPLWSLLRSVCLAVYWFDPLVWWAAAASKEDCELACDEGALRRLGEDQRIPYGQTLLRLIPLQRARGGVLLTATTMTSDKKRMKERITRIAENRKMKTAALCAALAVVVAVCAVTFTGCTADAAGKPDAPNAASDRPSAVAGPEDTADTLTIPLTDLVPYELQRVETLSVDDLLERSHHDEHHGQQKHRVGGGCNTTYGCGTFVWTFDGKTYVSSQNFGLSSFPGDYFLCIDNDYACVDEPFTNVLGYDGVVISYIGEVGSNYVETINDYYVFEDDGVYLLARVYGVPYLLDMNGDGTEELVGTDGSVQAQIFFQRDGKLYEANIPALLAQHWNRWDDDSWRTNSYFFGWSEIHPQYMELEGYVPVVAEDGSVTPLVGRRQLYFDGVNLYLCRPEREMTDHVLDGIQELNVVTDAAKAMVKATYEEFVANYGKGWADSDAKLPEWDDYCVTGIECVYPTEVGQLPDGVNLIVYRVSGEIHSPTPERVVWAGGTYVGEDGWVGGFWTEESPYLVFQILDDGFHKLLENHIASDVGPDAPVFEGEIAITLMQNQLMAPSKFSGETLFYGAECTPVWFMDALAVWPESEQDAALTKFLEYVDAGGGYESEHLRQIIEENYDYSEGGAKVVERLKNLMSAPLVTSAQ